MNQMLKTMMQAIYRDHPFTFFNKLGNNTLTTGDKRLIRATKTSLELSNSVINFLILYCLFKDNMLNYSYFQKLASTMIRNGISRNDNPNELIRTLALHKNPIYEPTIKFWQTKYWMALYFDANYGLSKPKSNIRLLYQKAMNGGY